MNNSTFFAIVITAMLLFAFIFVLPNEDFKPVETTINIKIPSNKQTQLDSLDKLIQDKETKLAMLNKVLHFKHLELMDYCPETHYKPKNTK